MSVYLVNPPGLRPGRAGSFFADQKRNLNPDQYCSMPMEHLGIASIAAYARSRGVEVQCVNGMTSSHSTVDETWCDVVSTAKRFGAPALVGFSTIDTFDEVLTLAKRCRQTWEGVRIAIGNTFATLNYDRILRDYSLFDFVLVGEAEMSFTLLAEALAEGKSVAEVPGLARRMDDGAIVCSAATSLDLDSMPWPVREELPAVLHAGFAGALFTTRGCPYRCTFCGTGTAAHMFGRDAYRARSVGNIVDEIEYLVRDFGIDFVSITDDLFLSKHHRMQLRAKAFGDEILRRRLQVSFMFDARLDSIVDLPLFAHLHRAGLRRIFVGLETGSYDQLVNYGKRSIRPGEDAAAKIRSLQELGIEIIPGTIMFHPEVTPSELRSTARLLRATGYRTPRKFLDRITAYSGTPLHSEYAAKGYLIKDWPVGEWAFAEPVAEGTYRRMAEYLHAHPSTTFDEAEELFRSTLTRLERQHLGGHEDRTVVEPPSATGVPDLRKPAATAPSDQRFRSTQMCQEARHSASRRPGLYRCKW